jgi:hypothetical protein
VVTVAAGGTLRRWWRAALRRVRQRGRSAVLRAARLAGAAAAAYLAAQWLGLVEPPPLVAALTALLVVQATAASTMVNGLQRVLAVMSGVGLAVGFVSVVGLSWWSLFVLVATSIVVGQLLRLGPHLVEVPISAMLVLGVGYATAAEAAALGRLLETLVGAAVGVLVNVLFPPAVRTRYAGRAVQRLAEEIAALLDEAAQGLGSPTAGSWTGSVTDSGNLFPTGTGWFTIPSVDRSSGDLGLTPEATGRWLDDARRLNRHVPRVDRALTHAEESRRLNVRAVRTPESSRSLRGGLEALELCSVAVRSLFRSIDDGVRAGLPEPDTAAVAEARAAWAELLGDLGVVVRAFGAVLQAEVGGVAGAEESALAEALDRLRRDRVRHSDVLLADPREHPGLWEINSAFVALVDRMLLELDADAHARLWEGPRQRQAGRRAAELLALLRSRRSPGARPEQGAVQGDQGRDEDGPGATDDAPGRRPDGGP